jgi:hypothetical protein
MKHSTPVKLEVGAPELSRSVRVIVLTDKLAERIGPRGLLRKRLKLQKFRSHRFTPEIQVRQLAPPEALPPGNRCRVTGTDRFCFGN